MAKNVSSNIGAHRLPESLTSTLVEKLQSLRSSVKTDYLKENLLSKFVDSTTAPADLRRSRAIEKWLATEKSNELTNERLIFSLPGDLIAEGVPFGRFVDFCRSVIRGIIGETAPIEALIGTFSGGASTSRPRTESHPASKYLGKAHVTLRCLSLFTDLVDELEGWIGNGVTIDPVVVPGNVMFTVPKKTDIDRVACKEPDLNMFIQKGIGSYFRKCLRSTGINLNDQSINRSLAHRGSVDGSLSTLDLSSASDSVTTELVSLLLPECWYTLLDSVRSPVTIIDGEEHRNEMFSSMGNGFTFELESLLFYTLARATAYFRGVRGIVSVYGDDIICPTELSTSLVEVLGFFGFSINKEKSFVEGSFRESCGGHYDNGVDITPFYIRAPIRTLPDLIDVANKLRQWGTVHEFGIINPEIEEIWLWLKSFVPSCLWGGEDTSFKFQLVSNDEPSHRLVIQTRRRDNGIGGYFHWLNASWDRKRMSDGIQTSSRTVEAGLPLRLRRIRSATVPRLPALFLTELC